MTHARIIGTGSYLPKKILTNKELEKMVDTTDEWIVERTGISQRHIIADDETVSSMSQHASEKAIAAAGIDKHDIDLIILATSTPERYFPSSAVRLQQALGLSECPAFDMNAACAGFIYGLDIADQYIKSGAAKTVLVVGADAMTRTLDWSNRSTCVLFGDGAGAVVLQASDQPGLMVTRIYSDGQYQDLLFAHNELGEKTVPSKHCLHMQGREVFKVAVRKLGSIVDETLLEAGISQDDIDWLIPHQANLRIIKATASKLGMPIEKVVLTVAEHGNTSAASIPLALDVGVRTGQVKPGELLLLEAFGAGFAWGAALVRF